MRIGPRLILFGIVLIAIPLAIVAFVAITRAGGSLSDLTDQQLTSRPST